MPTVLFVASIDSNCNHNQTGIWSFQMLTICFMLLKIAAGWIRHCFSASTHRTHTLRKESPPPFNSKSFNNFMCIFFVHNCLAIFAKKFLEVLWWKSLLSHQRTPLTIGTFRFAQRQRGLLRSTSFSCTAFNGRHTYQSTEILKSLLTSSKVLCKPVHPGKGR